MTIIITFPMITTKYLNSCYTFEFLTFRIPNVTAHLRFLAYNDVTFFICSYSVHIIVIENISSSNKLSLMLI